MKMSKMKCSYINWHTESNYLFNNGFKKDLERNLFCLCCINETHNLHTIYEKDILCWRCLKLSNFTKIVNSFWYYSGTRLTAEL